MSTAGIVVCGGRSTRMGRPKAWLPWRGRPMVAHVVSVLSPLVDRVVVVAAEGMALPPLDARVVRDRTPDLGPLAAIREGLDAAGSDWAFVTGTDAPFLSAAYVRALLSEGRAAAPVVDGHVQTLSAVYRGDAAPIADALLRDGRRRPLDLLEALDYHALAAEALPDTRSVCGFNTPEAYLAAVRETHDAPVMRLVLPDEPDEEERDENERERAVPVGTLAEILASAAAGMGVLDGACVAEGFLVRLVGHGPLTEAGVPIGPGELVTVSRAG